MIRWSPLLSVLICSPAMVCGAVADFENLPLAANSFYNGDPGGLQPGQSHDGSFFSGGAKFNNRFAVDADFGYSYWTGWAYSNQTNTTTPGFGNQYSAFAGSGASGSATYGIASLAGAPGPVIELPAGAMPVSINITNTTYAALSMKLGDSFAKRFGDNPATANVVETNVPDFFKMTVSGLDAGNQPVGSPIETYLADYRFANDAQDYILNTWRTVDLSTLSAARKLTFALTSSDNGVFGMNTPAYFAADNLVTAPVPEPGTMVLGISALAGLVACCRLRRR